MSWFYDELAGWLREGELDIDVPLHIFNEVAAELFGPPPVPAAGPSATGPSAAGLSTPPAPLEPVCSECDGRSVIVGVTDSGRHHRVEARY